MKSFSNIQAGSLHGLSYHGLCKFKDESMNGNGESIGKRTLPPNFLLITALDYRTPRKANLHFIADELVKRGTTRFFSLRYSMLSRYKADPRTCIDERANRKEMFNGAECFLWKTLIHPFNTRKKLLRPLENIFFSRYQNNPSAVLVEWMEEADIIFFESGSAPIFFDLACRVNPNAKKVYIASDDLDTINVADYVRKCFERAAPNMTALCLPSRVLSAGMPGTDNKYFVPHGIDHAIATQADPSPYAGGQHAVSVGSMLFDPSFFQIASRLFPDITFHLIGSGRDNQDYGENVRVYDEMKYKDTLRYIKHADFGIAPYRSEAVPAYLTDTSMKLMQYDFFGLPAVCPVPVVGSHLYRFGYQPGNAASIEAAIRAALSAPHTSSARHLSWAEVADRLLEPQRFEDTRL